MDAITVQCPTCRGLGVIGTSVGSNHSRGSTYDCDTCHGTGNLKLFVGVAPDETAAIRAEAKAEALREAADRAVAYLENAGSYYVAVSSRTINQIRAAITQEANDYTPIDFSPMIVCPVCGNKRCPKASDYRYKCTNSNDPGQTPELEPTE